jgi:hypothetical protein
MRTVDFSPFSDQSGHRETLDVALSEVDLGDARRVEPIDDAAAFGLGFSAELSNDQLRELSRDVRAQLEALLPEDFTVEFTIADADGDEGGAPVRRE